MFRGTTSKIYGGPGTGKTTTLGEILKRELDSGTKPDRIAYLTFTRAAANEMRSRVSGSFKFFRTIHSASMSMVGMSKGEVFGRDEVKILADAGFPMTKTQVISLDELSYHGYDCLMTGLSIARHTRTPIMEVVDRLAGDYDKMSRANMRAFMKVYQGIKRRTKTYDYDDMLTEYIDTNEPGPIDVLLIDEAQDLTRLQWEAVHLFGRTAKRVYIVGDDDQSIFAFMGGDEYGFLDHPADSESVLEKSWRCPVGVGRTAEKIISKVAKRKPKNIIWQEKPGRVDITGDITPQDIMEISSRNSVMFLARHNASLINYARELDEAGVPYSLRGHALINSELARAVVTYAGLKKGKSLPRQDVVTLLRVMGDTTNSRLLRQQTDLPTVRRQDVITKLDFELPWLDVFGRSPQRLAMCNRIATIVRRQGPDVVNHAPAIELSTMHSAKGREADIVVIDPSCNAKSFNSCTMGSPTETRLCFVAVTRAKKSVKIMAPNGDRYMTPLM